MWGWLRTSLLLFALTIVVALFAGITGRVRPPKRPNGKDTQTKP
jgi:hypothetical protein